jgi:hypothetical protein
VALSIFEETFGKERVRFGKVSKREATAEHLFAITEAVQRVVDTFRDPNTGQRFLVSLSAQTEAYSDPDNKRIVVSYRPIFDKGLKVSTVCTVMTGLVLHEIGHTLYTFPNHPVIEATFGKPGEYTGVNYYDRKKAWDQLAYTVLNIGDDARLEARMTEALPIAAGIFPTMLHWVAVATQMVDERFRWKGKAMSMSDRVNFAGRSIRYPWTATWSNDQYTRDERLWWQAWGRDYIGLADHDADGMVRLIKVATERLRNPEDLDFDKVIEPPQPPGPGGRKPGIEDEDEDEPKDKPKGESKPPFGDDFDKDDDDEDDDEDEDEADDDESDDEDSDEDGDESDEDADDEQDESDEDKPEPDDEGGYESDEDADDDEQDEDKPKGGSKTDAPSDNKGDDEGKDGDPDGEGKTGGDAKADEDKPGGFPDDFDAHDLKGNVDAINNPTGWRDTQEGALVQKVLDGERAVERVGTGKWGTAKVEVRSIAQMAERRY